MGHNETMSGAVEITGTQLANALRSLDVNFIMGGQDTNEALHKQLACLIAALAESNESRLRLSRFFGNSPQFWIGLQAQYDLDIAQDRLGKG